MMLSWSGISIYSSGSHAGIDDERVQDRCSGHAAVCPFAVGVTTSGVWGTPLVTPLSSAVPTPLTPLVTGTPSSSSRFRSRIHRYKRPLRIDAWITLIHDPMFFLSRPSSISMSERGYSLNPRWSGTPSSWRMNGYTAFAPRPRELSAFGDSKKEERVRV